MMSCRYPTLERDHLSDIEEYAQSVLLGKPSNRYEILAIQRESDDLLAAANDPDFKYYFDPEAALKVIRFIETFHHVKGRWASETGVDGLIVLEGWQKWIIAQVFGWKVKKTGFRRFRSAYICVPRKNGKSVLAAGIALYMLAHDGEFGAEVYCGATNQKQAWEVFRPAKRMAQKQPAFRKKFGIQIHANKLEKTVDGSRFEPIIGDPGDGSSPSLYIGDEYHEHDTDNQRDTMVTGMGAREQGLELLITTAGTNPAGPCALHQKDVEKVLEGVHSDESLFGLIYTIDKDDDWKSEQALIKANPNYGISVSADFLKDELSKAIQSARKQNKFKTKHLNIWCGAKESWLNSEDWVAAGDKALSLDDFKGMVCGNGLDLSKTDDLTSRVKCFVKEIDGIDHYYFFGNHYVTKVKAADNQLYQGWINEGWLIECDANDGKMIDYQLVRDDFDEDLLHFEIEDIYHDPAGANVLAQQIDTSTNVEAVEIPQTFRVFSPYMRDFEVLLSAGRIHHNGDPVLAWCFSNVVAKETQDGKYIRPVKEGRDNKIDGAVAALMAFIKVYEPKDEYDDQQAMEEYLNRLGA